MKTVLIVDDNKDMRFLLTNFLSSNGYDVFAADDGVMAVNALENDIPDLVLLDIRLPKLNGIEVLKRIKEIDEGIKVILITAYSNLSSRNKAVEYGANDYLTKPFDNNDLLERISKVFEY